MQVSNTPSLARGMPASSDTAAHARTLSVTLGALESECGSIVERLVREFEALAARVTEVLHLAGITAESIEAAEVTAIPGKVEGLVAGTERFVRDRLEASVSVMEVVRNEQELVENLLRINAANRSIAQEIRMLSLLTRIEVARLGDFGAGFQYLARELQAASETVAESAVQFAARARTRNRVIRHTERKMAAALPRLRKQMRSAEMQLQRALGDVRLSVEELSACPVQFRASVEMVAARISGVVSAIQVYDITRQQSEHVREALDRIATRLDTAEGEARPAEMALALRAQALQLDNVRQAMNTWSSQIDECLENILDVSQSRLEQVAPLVLAQEKQLLGRLVQIEEVERECEKDTAEISEAFSGLAGLLQMVGEHAGVARMNRDRLQMLSFNSIIEARNMGVKADVMMEISRNITRVAGEWGRLAERSSRTRSEIQRLMDEANASVAALGVEKGRELRDARTGIGCALADLEAAARSTAVNGASLSESTGGLVGQIETARFISNSLKDVIAEIGHAIEELEALRRLVHASEEEIECDLAGLEAELSRDYTTEIERSILRAALYGEALPAVASDVSGNDVELF